MVTRSFIGRSALGLAIYSLCVVFVFSFILFEVLDVDGSDFPSSATQAIAAEAPHADIRRLHFEPVPDPMVPPVVPALREPERVPVPVIGRARPAPTPTQQSPHRRFLARASLPDAPPAA